MITPIAMPRLGMTMREGIVREWPIPLGERIEKGQVVLLIESEKAEVEVEATASGVLRHIYVEPDETVPCGTLLGAITETADEPFDAKAYAREHGGAEVEAPSAAPEAPAVAKRATAPAAGAPEPGARRPVAPAARALARKLGLDVEAVEGTGPGGRITRQDVEAFAARREALSPVAAGVALEVLRDGTGEPVVLLPGFGTDVSSFAFQTRVLVEGYRVLAVNPRGVGLSDAPDLPRYDVEVAARDAAALIEEPAHLIGASLGAAAALELALAHPDRVRSLVLVTPFVEATARLRAVADAWCHAAREASPEALARILLPWLFSEAFLARDDARERTLRGLAAMAPRVPAPTLARSAAGLVAWSGTRRDALGKIAVPTLVLVGGGDLLTPDGEAVARAIPGARTVVVPGAGHALAIEAPDAVNQAIRAHLEAAG